LKDAEALLGNPRFAVPEGSAERAYLDACGAAQLAREAAEKQEQERRIRDAERIAEEQKKAAAAQKRTARATLIGLAVAVLVAGLAIWQYFEATRQRQLAEQRQKEAEAQKLAAQSDLAFKTIGRYLERSALLAIESMRRVPSVEGDRALRQSSSLLPKELIRVTHEGYVVALAFSSDGRYLATGSWDKTARVVEFTTGKELIRVSHEGIVDALAFSPDGRVLYTGTENEKVATLLRHLLRAEDLIAATCGRLTRNLTAEEWTRYLGDTPYRKTCPDLPGPDDSPQAAAIQPRRAPARRHQRSRLRL